MEQPVPALWEFGLFVTFVSWAVFVSGFLWLLYISLEPFVRRRWPASLISWSRLLSGTFRDPLVGRDVLAGCVLGAASLLLGFLIYPVASWIGAPQEQPFVGGMLHMFLGARAVVAFTPFCVVICMFYSLALLFTLFLLRVLLRSEWAAVVVLLLTLTARDALRSDSLLLGGIFSALGWGIFLFLLVRFGLLATAVAVLFKVVFVLFPVTTQLSAWYSGIGLTGLALLLGLTVYAFHTSLGGRPLFGRAMVED